MWWRRDPQSGASSEIIRSEAPQWDRPVLPGERECSTPRAQPEVSAKPPATNVSGSFAVTPYSRLVIRRVKPKAAPMPNATPTSANFVPCLRTICSTSPRSGSKRQTNANFAFALRHRVRHHAIDADDSQRRAPLSPAIPSITRREGSLRHRFVVHLVHRSAPTPAANSNSPTALPHEPRSENSPCQHARCESQMSQFGSPGPGPVRNDSP